MDKIADLERRIRALETRLDAMTTQGSKARPLSYTYYMDPKARGRVLKVSVDAENETMRFERS